MNRPESHVLIIFGASGDLTKRKLIPAIYQLYRQKFLPEHFAVLGASRSHFTDEEFRERISEFLPEQEDTCCEDFLSLIHYQSVETHETADFSGLVTRLDQLCSDYSIPKNFLFYLSTPPALYGVIPERLSSVGLNNSSSGFRRLIVEKPFGTDLESAMQLNQQLLDYFDEDQIYRIDHYLGKETVQNLLVFRFSNSIFEPIWNRNFIDRVEVTSAESLGVEDRGGYYDHSGALRDMFQNHLLQTVGMVAMEPPTVMEANAIRNETMKVFQSLRPFTADDVKNNVIRGQYTTSIIKGESQKSYREEKGVDSSSRTETFIGIKFYIDNWRWGGVPFYVRSGKKLPTRVSEVVIHFKSSPQHLFQGEDALPQINNQLIIRIQPDEGILLKFGMKEPGAGFVTKPVNMDFHYKDLSAAHLPTAYERLIHDCMIGDATLYARGDAVMAAWRFVQPIQELWKKNPSLPVYGYPAGTWGPAASDELVEGEGQTWRYPCKNLTDDGLYCEL